MKYPVFVYGNDQVGYSVTVPDIPGARATTHKLDNVKHEAWSAAEHVIEDLIEKGRHLPARRNIAFHMMQQGMTEDTWITWIDIEGWV